MSVYSFADNVISELHPETMIGVMFVPNDILAKHSPHECVSQACLNFFNAGHRGKKAIWNGAGFTPVSDDYPDVIPPDHIGINSENGKVAYHLSSGLKLRPAKDKEIRLLGLSVATSGFFCGQVEMDEEDVYYSSDEHYYVFARNLGKYIMFEVPEKIVKGEKNIAIAQGLAEKMGFADWFVVTNREGLVGFVVEAAYGKAVVKNGRQTAIAFDLE